MTLDTEPATTGRTVIPRSVTCSDVDSRGESTHLRFAPEAKAARLPSCLAVGVLVAALLAPVGTASALEGLRFETVASPAQEVPPADSDGAAEGRFRFSDDLSELAARVDVEDLTGDVLNAHLHCGIAGVNGPIIVDLLPGSSGRIVDDVFFNEDVTNDPVCAERCGFEINNIASLRQAAADGCLYFNAHTDAFSGGEVRGQLLAR